MHDERIVQKLKTIHFLSLWLFLKSRPSLTSSAKTKEEKMRQVFPTICMQLLPKRVRVAAFYEHISSPVFLSNITDLLRGKCLTTPGPLSELIILQLKKPVICYFFFFIILHGKKSLRQIKL